MVSLKQYEQLIEDEETRVEEETERFEDTNFELIESYKAYIHKLGSEGLSNDESEDILDDLDKIADELESYIPNDDDSVEQNIKDHVWQKNH
jgi:Na+/phosphate symporter